MLRETIAIGADHAGYAMKAVLAADLAKMGYDVLDLGTNSEVRSITPTSASRSAGR